MSPPEFLYHRYVTLCAEVNHRPVPFASWLLLLEEVPCRDPMGFPLSRKPIDTGAAAYRKPKRPDAEVLADVLAALSENRQNTAAPVSSCLNIPE